MISMISPTLSLVIISYNMRRELPRTLYSLSRLYQRDIQHVDYEVIVVDNGSQQPPHATDFQDLDLPLRCLHAPNPTCSPAAAINFGIEQTSGHWVGVWIDGARIASPRLVATALEALNRSPHAIVATRGRYLGPGPQSQTMQRGYNQVSEDLLLNRCDWKNHGYRLFANSVFDESSGPTWFADMSESNALFLSKSHWEELGGYDERFTSPGGGLVSLDTWQRAISLPRVVPIALLGEATFHQFHGGTMTNAADQAARWKSLCSEYEAIRGTQWSWPQVPLTYWGRFHEPPPPSELVSHGSGWSSAWSKIITEVQRPRRFFP